jgi:hypothetical protein
VSNGKKGATQLTDEGGFGTPEKKKLASSNMINNRFTLLLLLAITYCSRPVFARIYQTVDAIIVEGIITPIFLRYSISTFCIKILFT